MRIESGDIDLIQSLTESCFGFADSQESRDPSKKSWLAELQLVSPAKTPIIETFLDVDNVNQNAFTSTYGEKVFF